MNKLKNRCGHDTELIFWAEQEGQIVHWCSLCGSIQFEKFSRGAFGTKEFKGVSKRRYPKIAFEGR
jgi:hypothetical protein